MARADLLLSLVRAGTRGDHALFQRTVEAIIAEEGAKQHHILAKNLSDLLNNNGRGISRPLSTTNEGIQGLIYEITPERSLDDLVLSNEVISSCHELAEEHHRGDLLRSHSLEPRHRVLLVGPPGNGKTSLAEALAYALMLPMLVVRYEGVVASYLGETALRLRRLFDHVREHHCLLFFDEFDTLGKERGDLHETGEIKRVVSSLLLQIDALPSYVVVVAATNHHELLDRAVWRRFQLRLPLPKPNQSQLEEWFRRFEKRLGLSLGVSLATLAKELSGTSFGEVEEFGNDVIRRYVLEVPNGDLERIVRQRLEQWRERFRAPDPKSE